MAIFPDEARQYLLAISAGGHLQARTATACAPLLWVSSFTGWQRSSQPVE